eukprot:349913-Chlamydomonas_euryale.AAC.1
MMNSCWGGPGGRGLTGIAALRRLGTWQLGSGAKHLHSRLCCAPCPAPLPPRMLVAAGPLSCASTAGS